MTSKTISGEEIREQLAELEHKQWMCWTKSIIKSWLEPLRNRPNDALAVLINHWGKNHKPYKRLPEETKEHDRVWADKVLILFSHHTQSRLKSLRERIEKMEGLDGSELLLRDDVLKILEEEE